jgi:hypothetical protein
MSNEPLGKPEAQPPVIWNPNAAANWSLLFSPAFGAYIHMLNWRRLGESANAAAARRWFFASVVMLATLLLLQLAVPDERTADGASRALGVIFLFSWYFTSARAQARYVTARLGASYERRSWGRPVGLAVLVALGFSLASLAGGFAIDMAI